MTNFPKNGDAKPCTPLDPPLIIMVHHYPSVCKQIVLLLFKIHVTNFDYLVIQHICLSKLTFVKRSNDTNTYFIWVFFWTVALIYNFIYFLPFVLPFLFLTFFVSVVCFVLFLLSFFFHIDTGGYLRTTRKCRINHYHLFSLNVTLQILFSIL